jgi:hypothetical protein
MMSQEVISGIDRLQKQEEIHPNFSRKYKNFWLHYVSSGNPVFEKSILVVDLCQTFYSTFKRRWIKFVAE